MKTLIVEDDIQTLYGLFLNLDDYTSDYVAPADEPHPLEGIPGIAPRTIQEQKERMAISHFTNVVHESGVTFEKGGHEVVITSGQKVAGQKMAETQFDLYFFDREIGGGLSDDLALQAVRQPQNTKVMLISSRPDSQYDYLKQRIIREGVDVEGRLARVEKFHKAPSHIIRKINQFLVNPQPTANPAQAASGPKPKL